MRIHSVTIAGFGPFKDAQHVDFDAFAGDGLFLITGRTGAGKSSILDAICFALYGGIPRYETDTQTSKMRSDYCSPDDISEVNLEFSVGTTKYRVTRTPEYDRPAKRKNGTGLVTTKATAELAVFENSNWRVTHARLAEVGNELKEILKLSRGEFQQVILLAQNRFQEFLTAKDDKRQAVLRTLFNTKRFLDYEEELSKRKAASEKKKDEAEQEHHAALRRAADLVGPDTLPTLNTIADAANAADADIKRSTREAKKAETGYAAALRHQQATQLLATYQERYNRAKETIDRLDADAAAVAEARQRLGNAERADKVLPYRTGRDEASNDLQTALTVETGARTQYTGEESTTVGLASHIETVTQQIGALDDAFHVEAALPDLVDTVVSARAALDDVEGRIVVAQGRRDAIPGERSLLSERLSAAAILAARVGDLEVTVAGLVVAETAAAAVTDLDGKLTLALTADFIAGRARTDASVALDAVHARRLRGHAAELATQLVDGSPCEVCGSLSHPAPAVSNDPIVSEADVEQAEEALATTDDNAKTASAVVNDLKVQLAGERSKMADQSVEEIAGSLTFSRSELSAAEAASVEVIDLRQQLTQLDADSATLESEWQDLQESRETAATTLTAAETTLRTAETSVRKHRGDFDSVSSRRLALQTALLGTQTFLGAMESVANKRELLKHADKRFMEELVVNGFMTADELELGILPASEQLELRSSIRQVEVERAAAKSALVEPELVDLPEEQADMEAAEEALRLASDNRDRTHEASRAAELLARQLGAAVPNLRRQAKQLDELTGRYEVIHRLAASVRGDIPNEMRMKLEAFVLAAELEQIVDAANTRLREMSDGRYELAHTDALRARGAQSGLGLEVVDSHTGRPRSTQSLSGGETFLASLALALGLAEVVTSRAGGIRLETLFIDEGFGSLDSDTLEIAMGTLDSLRTSGRTVGLISHVETMKEQIPAKLSIDVADGGWSVISQPEAV